MDEPQAVYTRWDDLPHEAMRGGITRRYVNSDKMMVAQVYYQKGDNVPPHRHDNEQYTYVLTGALRFRFGEDQKEELVVGPGEIVFIPSGLLHSASADEATFELDIFNPPRADWLDGSDGYFRSEG